MENRRVRVFLASPGDVGDERGVIRNILGRLRLDPGFREKAAIETVAWEEGGGPPIYGTITPQEAISRGLPRPRDCDLVVVILWSRMGTPLPDSYKKADGTPYQSGTEWEFEDALAGNAAAGKPEVLVYRCVRPISLRPTDPQFDSSLRQCLLVDQFFKQFYDANGAILRGMTTYTEVEEFKEKVEQHLRGAINQLLVNNQPAPPPPSPTLQPTVKNNLEARTGQMLGREADMARVLEVLASRYPLVAIEGFPGVGKTRLALEAGYACVGKSDFATQDTVRFDYVVWISAKDKLDQEQWLNHVLNATADVLDFPTIRQLPSERLDQKKDEVGRLLRTRCVLLIINNFERIRHADLVQWIEAVPEPSKVLLTTRVREIRASYAIELSGLDSGSAVEFIRQEASKLALRHIAPLPDGALLPLVVVSAGNPRVIEMALGQVKGGRTMDEVVRSLFAPAPHQSVDDVLESLYRGSWSAVSDAARDVLLAVPLFSGAASIAEAALQAASGLETSEFRRAVEQLLGYKLLELNYGTQRFNVSPMTLTFTRAQLDCRGPQFERSARERWGQYFLQYVQTHARRKRPKERYWNALVSPTMSRIDEEWPTVAQVLEWADQNGQDGLLVDLVMLLVHYMDSRFLNVERVKYVQRAIEAAHRLELPEDEAILRIDALGWTYVEENRFDEARSEIDKGLKVARQIGGRRAAKELQVLGLAWQARIILETQSPAAALEVLDEALALAVHCAPVIQYRVNLVAGDVAFKDGREADALKHYHKAVNLSEQYGREGGGYQTSPRIGLALLQSNELETAEEEFRKLTRESEIATGQFYGRYGQALVAYKRGDKQKARRLAETAKQELQRRTTPNALLKLIGESFNDLQAADPMR